MLHSATKTMSDIIVMLHYEASLHGDDYMTWLAATATSGNNRMVKHASVWFGISQAGSESAC